MADIKPTTDAPVETVTETAAKPERKGVQLSTIVHDTALVDQLNFIKRARDLANTSEIVREAVTEYAVNHADEAAKYKEFFGIKG